MRLFVAFVVLSLCAACGPKTQGPTIAKGAVDDEIARQQELAFLADLDARRRVNRLGSQLAFANADLCQNVGHAQLTSAFTVANRYSLPSSQRKAANRALNLGEKPQIIILPPSGPAAAAGLQLNDLVLSYDDVQIGEGAKAVANLNKAVASAGKKIDVPVTVMRGGSEVAVQLHRLPACKYGFSPTLSNELNAFANGTNITVTRGMLRFASSDEELALILGHEMAHNLQKHMQAKRANAAAGMVADVLLAALTGVASNNFARLGANAYTQSFESEADYVGLYLAARAGFVIVDAPQIWRRMAAEEPANIKRRYSGTHPPTSQRFVALEAAAKEIDDKRTAGLPLLPNLAKQPGTADAETFDVSAGTSNQ